MHTLDGTRGDANQMRNAMRAAEDGDFKVLRTSLLLVAQNENSKREGKAEINRSFDRKYSRCSSHTIAVLLQYSNTSNALFTTEDKDTILHLVLKRPKFTEVEEKANQIRMVLNYMKCANILFDKLPKKLLLFLVNQ